MIWPTCNSHIATGMDQGGEQSPKRRIGKSSGRHSAASGFSLIELIIVVSIVLMSGAIAVINMPPALAAMRMNSAVNTTAETLKLARSSAFADRLVYRVDFIFPQTLTITQVATGTIVRTTTLPVGVNFDAEPGLPATAATTPDGFGTGAITGPIDFDADFGAGGLNQLFFYPDGSARDGNGHINNGIVYIARPGDLSSSKAITLWGLTGRVKKWSLSTPVNGVRTWGQL